MDGIPSKVSVPRGGLHLRVTEQLANHRQTFADQETAAGEAMTQVVDPHIVEPGARPDAPPGVLKVGQMAPRLASRDHPRAVVLPVDPPSTAFAGAPTCTRCGHLSGLMMQLV